jgi:hypothetical protein
MWFILLIFTSFIGILLYLVTQSRGMAERNAERAAAARDEIRKVVGFSAADEIEKLDRLRKSGSISESEFKGLRAKLVS